MFKIQQLNKVYLNADVFAVCLQHALSTEKEEVMGLLIGEVDEENGISHISSCLILRRSDKQADRVEISPEQLMAATSHAEQLTISLKRPMRVVGWYHSHPHITVWPSRVDVGTQELYQSMDSFFVGLIFSVFPNETRNGGNYSKTNEIQVACFQSLNDDHIEIPLIIKDSEFTPSTLEMMAELPKILREEENEVSENYLTEAEDVDPLVNLHNIAFKFSGMVHITDKIARPICEAFLNRLTSNKQIIDCLQEEKKLLIERLRALEIETDAIYKD